MIEQKLIDRFWSLIDRSGGPDACWFPKSKLTWDRNHRGFHDPSVFCVNYQNYTMHKFAYMIEHGVIPRRMVVRHRCGWGCCVNPAHLILGTYQQNQWDRYAREWAGIQPDQLATYEDIPGYVPVKGW